VQIETTERSLEDYRREPRLVRLECGVQHYDWGDRHTIPAILGRANPTGRPFAELWVGAHPDLPAVAVVAGVRVPLDELVASAPERILGPPVARRFGGELPFLLKVLAAGKPLSIQAHPNAAQARAGFARENRVGLPLDAATRSYHDPHHKPELLVAASDFYALRGFRPLEEVERLLGETPEMAPLDAFFQAHGRDLGTLYAHILHLDQASLNALLAPLLGRLDRENGRRPFPPSGIEHWLLRADREYSAPGHRDPGLLSMLLLNLVRLRPGQAIFLPAGELHAYLQGVGIELMANSNNVLRGGLTHKHVDVDELLRTLGFHTGPAALVAGVGSPDEPGCTDYPTPTGELALCRLELPGGGAFARGDGAMTLGVVTAGRLRAEEEGRPPIALAGGDGLLAPAGTRWRLRALEDAVCWLARVPAGEAQSGGG
jgi:mannose-6-phosphate isomerase class I